MKKVGFCTLGCKVNQYETEAMSQAFKRAGYEVSDFEDKCEVYVINTCTVTNMSDRKSRQMISRAKKRNPDALIVAAGCYAQVAPEKMKEMGISLIIGTDQKSRITELVEEQLEKGEALCTVGNIMKVRAFEEMKVDTYQERTRAYIKIQEGCDRFCSYCIIPYARGPVRSRPLVQIIEEAKRLVSAGFSELILTGIHVASYGKDLKEGSLIEVMEAVHAIEGLCRLRLSSIDPLAFTEDFIERIKKLPKVCPHFHISLQSGCQKTLERMNRRYTPKEYARAVSSLREALPHVAITTDVICGFPGETEEEFSQSLAFIESMNFAMIHVFPYSERSGTPAATMEGAVLKSIREERSKEVARIGNVCQRRYLESFLGKTVDVLFEQSSKGPIYEGHTETYIKVAVESGEDIRRRILSVRITEINKDGAKGVLAV